MCRALGLFRTHKQCVVETGQMSCAETGQMSAVETGQMPAAETGQMSAVETRQMSAVGGRGRGRKAKANKSSYSAVTRKIPTKRSSASCAQTLRLCKQPGVSRIAFHRTGAWCVVRGLLQGSNHALVFALYGGTQRRIKGATFGIHSQS